VIDPRPAYSAAFAPDVLPTLEAVPGLDNLTPAWAWEGSTGRGVRVAVIDSGIDAGHPAVGGVQGYVAITEGQSGPEYDLAPHEDAYGHGTACAGIIRALAPDCELYSVRVLGPTLGGRGVDFAAGLRWAIERGMQICNLSLSTSRKEFFGLFHELADLAYFRNVALVAAANNLPLPSFPSTYAAVLSVAAHDRTDPECVYYNPHPPVEFGAPGIDLQVAWRKGEWITTTGNSFAAPHITGLVARILAKYPSLTIFQLKTILRALAANVSRERCGAPGAETHPVRRSSES
jgi:subtilisin